MFEDEGVCAGSRPTDWVVLWFVSPTAASLLWLIVQSGLLFTAYSEVQFKALDQISPVTHAVGNTMRRVVIMVVCIAVFGIPVSVLGGVGSAIAIGGSYAYAMAKTAEKEEGERQKQLKMTAEGGESATNEEVLTRAQAEHPLLPLMKLVGRWL